MRFRRSATSAARTKPLPETRRVAGLHWTGWKEHGQTCDDPKGAAMPRKATEAAAPKRTAARRTVTRRTKKTETIEPTVLVWEHVATRAYFIHLEDGGDPLENWLRAERELVAA